MKNEKLRRIGATILTILSISTLVSLILSPMMWYIGILPGPFLNILLFSFLLCLVMFLFASKLIYDNPFSYWFKGLFRIKQWASDEQDDIINKDKSKSWFVRRNRMKKLKRVLK